ncbi:MAG: hypothetical protein K2L22_09000 [Muribaculaceae bacterium]|nr:hypothetical protein [Muribaculaceae bacterium]
MKKIILLIGILLCISVHTVAAKEDVLVTILLKGQDLRNTTVKRTPMQAPVEIYYDEVTQTVEVTGDNELEAQVYIKDESGRTLAYSSSINTTLIIPYDYSGILLVCIETEYWSVIGEIEI